MAGDKKRKRASEANDDAAQNPFKKVAHESPGGTAAPTTANGASPAKTKGQLRQEKSERRKKVKEAKKLNKELQKQRKREKKQKRTRMPEVVHAGRTEANMGRDEDLAGAQNFVALSYGPTRAWTAAAKKRRSPRSIRKEARQLAQAAAVVTNDGTTVEKEEPQQDNAEDSNTTADARFICFVGNLPYSATTEQIAEHFSKLQPQSIRLSTDKETGKSKGFAFLEFDSYDRMKTCLKLYHHSTFDPEGHGGADGNDNGTKKDSKDSISRGRKINVELTAGGGGGKSTERRDKIKAKNKKLDEERARDWEKKKKEEAEKGQQQDRKRNALPASGANAEASTGEEPSADTSGIHPSRLSRVRV